MSRILAAVLAAFMYAPASAELVERDWRTPGDRLLTFDPSTGLEWLDITETLLSDREGVLIEDRYQAVVAETLPGGRLEGFSVATREQATSLARAAGALPYDDTSVVDEAGIDRLMEYVGQTGLFVNGSDRLLAGLLGSTSLEVGVMNELNRDALVAVHRVDGDTASAAFSLVPAYNIGADVYLDTDPRGPQSRRLMPGVMLARSIPEPTTAVIVAWALVLIALGRRS